MTDTTRTDDLHDTDSMTDTTRTDDPHDTDSMTDTTPSQAPQRCPYCDRPEQTERLLALHVGEEHWEVATATERSRYETEYEAESAALWRFRLLSVAALVVLYFGFLFAYAVVG